MLTPDILAYEKAVARLLPIAQADTSASRIAAQVLLSTYNGHDYHLDATDLCYLDDPELAAAITVLSQRPLTRREPHGLNPNFEAGFSRIIEVWGHLNVRTRYASYYG